MKKPSMLKGIATGATCLLFTGCASVVTLTRDQASRFTRLHVGQKLAIRLSGNRTTHYEWRAENLGASILRADSQEFVVDAHPVSVVGVGGTEVFRYTAVVSGSTTLRFKQVYLAKPEQKAEQAQFNIEVRGRSM